LTQAFFHISKSKKKKGKYVRVSESYCLDDQPIGFKKESIALGGTATAFFKCRIDYWAIV
jgi:hypothetical protein